ncbi:hypothetical protein GOODEAATRI_010057 [Goodea atripinnis]|uniref:Uncharacterized protein n=1 Tax=Goodea atripinnis TaxID=208336 RepID=A0ABV0PXJ0_9TELE
MAQETNACFIIDAHKARMRCRCLGNTRGSSISSLSVKHYGDTTAPHRFRNGVRVSKCFLRLYGEPEGRRWEPPEAHCPD